MTQSRLNLHEGYNSRFDLNSKSGARLFGPVDTRVMATRVLGLLHGEGSVRWTVAPDNLELPRDSGAVPIQIYV